MNLASHLSTWLYTKVLLCLAMSQADPPERGSGTEKSAMSGWSGDPFPPGFPKTQTTLPTQTEKAGVQGQPKEDKGFRVLSSSLCVPQDTAALALQQQAVSILTSPGPEPKTLSQAQPPPADRLKKVWADGNCLPGPSYLLCALPWLPATKEVGRPEASVSPHRTSPSIPLEKRNRSMGPQMSQLKPQETSQPT